MKYSNRDVIDNRNPELSGTSFENKDFAINLNGTDERIISELLSQN